MRKWLAANDDRYSVYDEGGQWLDEYDATGAPLQQIVWLRNLPVAVLAGSGASQRLYYIEADALGTPRVVVAPTRGTLGTAVWRWDLTGEAFGTTAPNQDPDGDSVAFVFDMRFPGQRYDAVSGLNYNYFRDYDPTGGRYVQSDPVGMRGGLSTYGYASKNPMSLVDPKGLLAFGPTCNAQMRAAIIQAVIELSNEITNKANSAVEKCEKGKSDFFLAGDVMRNVSSMIFSCDNTFLCAQTLINGVAYFHPAILTAPKVSEVLKPGQCGCLKGVISHEATHQARWGMSENDVRRKTLDCVSCAQNISEHGDSL